MMVQAVSNVTRGFVTGVPASDTFAFAAGSAHAAALGVADAEGVDTGAGMADGFADDPPQATAPINITTPPQNPARRSGAGTAKRFRMQKGLGKDRNDSRIRTTQMVTGFQAEAVGIRLESVGRNRLRQRAKGRVRNYHPVLRLATALFRACPAPNLIRSQRPRTPRHVYAPP